jgi:CheY-like chemotaxis protein
LALGVGNQLGAVERVLLVLFMVTFPVIVLVVFRELVIKHTGRLYGPADYRDDKTFQEVTKPQLDVVSSLTVAFAEGSRSGTADQSPPDSARLLATAQRATAATRTAVRAPKILWVDDRPDNNIHERGAMEAAGFSVHTALTTEAAERRVAKEPFDVIISDMGRPEGPQAGYDLLERLRASGKTTPFIIYASSGSAEHRAEAKRRGAVGCTNNPAELLEMVTAAIAG